MVVGVYGVGLAYATARLPAPLVPGTARLVPGDAAVTVHRATPIAAADAPLRSGDVLTVDRGTVTLQTAAGRLVAQSGTTIAFTDTSPRVMRGDVLVVAKGFEIATRNASAVVDGITRIRQELSVEFGVYRGSAAVHTFDRDINVPVLRRAVIAGSGGATSMSTRPLSLDATDLWDRQLLGTALELDVALSSRSRGLTMQVAGRGDEVVSKVLAATGWRDLTSLGQEPVGEVVVAAELAKFVGGGADVARAALRLRDEGASWGLVAVANGLRRPPRAFPEVDAVAVPVFGEPRLVTGYVTAVSSAPTTIVAGSTIPKVKLPLTTPTTAPGTGGSVVNVVPVQQDPPIVDPIGTVVRGVGNVIGGLLGN